MVLIVNYSKHKINVILYAASIAAIVLGPPAASRCFSPFTGDRRLAAKLEVVKIILSALGATLDQPFFTLLRLHGDQANYFRSVSACACFIDPVGYPCGIGGN